MRYTERKHCIFCHGESLLTCFQVDKSIPMGNNVVYEKRDSFYTMPYNIQQCSNCLSFQTKYLADVHILYENAFAGAYGSIRSTHNTLFSSFIAENINATSLCEIGAGNGELSDILLEHKEVPYTIIDPSFCGKKDKKKILSTYFEESKETDISANTIIMSHVFEHFYNPLDILKKLESLQSIEFIYLSFPDLESFIQDGTYLVLTPEHTFYIDTSFLIRLFEQYGFSLQRRYTHVNHSVFLEFYRTVSPVEKQIIRHDSSVTKRVHRFFTNLESSIQRVNTARNKDIPCYIWPCSMHSIFCLSLGLPKDSILNVLDNSPLKIGNYLFGYNILCRSFKEVIQSQEKKTILLAGGCYTKEIIDEVQENTHNSVFLL